jgi:diaminopropionate ammonia-lyase family
MIRTYVPADLPRPQGSLTFSDNERAERDCYAAALGPSAVTPLVDRPDLARALNLAQLWVKDETHRMGLPAFKLLGARFAIASLLTRRRITSGATLVCASEGNHGRAVARAAREVGCHARIYLSHAVAAPRADAIASEGAAVVRIGATYDEAVRHAAADAAREGWTIISDTSWEGYEEVPRLIMLGYSQMVHEMCAQQPPDWRPDLIVVPGGVGGLLAGVALGAAEVWSVPPRILCVEPDSAACLMTSARAGTPTPVNGPFTTEMGGLRCGEVSPLAFAMAAPHVAAYVTVDDDWGACALRMMARPTEAGATPVRAGLSGAAALAGLMAIRAGAEAAHASEALRLSSRSTAVVIASEGVTDPPLWARLMGEDASPAVTPAT